MTYDKGPIGGRVLAVCALIAAALVDLSCVGGGGGSSAGGGSPGAGNLTVDPPDAFVATGEVGGPFDATATYTLGNDGSEPLIWSAGADVDWLDLSLATGPLDPGATMEVVVSIDGSVAGSASEGQYTGEIGFLDVTSMTLGPTVAAQLTIGGSGSLVVTPGDDFDAGGPKGGPFPETATFILSNPGTAGVSWSTTTDATWLSLSSPGGTLAGGGQAQVIASVDLGVAGAFGFGDFEGTLSFRDDTAGATALQVAVRLHVGVTIQNGRWLTVNGQEFFPIFVWQQPPEEAWVAYHESLGINTYMDHGWNPNPDFNEALLALCAQHDMYAVLEFDANPNVMGHPRLLSWMLGDEPDHAGTPPSQSQAEYDAIKAADPDHPVVMNLTSRFYWDGNFGDPSVEPLYQSYTDITEIISFDHYPVTGWNQPTWVYMDGAMTRFMYDVYVANAKPVWAIVEASDQRLSWTPPGTPGPTPEQMRLEAWDSVINGATAIGYFTIAFNPFEWANLTPAIEAEMTRTNGQITALSQIILSDPPALALATVDASGRDHDVTLRQSGTTTWVFCANTDMGYNAETITFQFDQPPISVAVYDESRTILPSGNTFTDTFAPLEVHIYQVEF